MSGAGMQLIGDKKLKRKLLNLAENVQRKVLRQAVTKAARPVVRSARSKANKKSGLLKKSIGSRVKTYKNTETVVAIIGPKSGVKGTPKQVMRKHTVPKRLFGLIGGGTYKAPKTVTPWPTLYAHLVHNGHVTKSGKHVPGNPFLRNAMNEQQGAALDTLKTSLAAGIIKEASK